MLFIPSNKILTPNEGNKLGHSIALASKEWYSLQTNVQAVLNLPFDMASFEARYGDASSGTNMKECFDAMRQLRSVAHLYGNPKQLRSKIITDPTFFAQDRRPEGDIYSSIAWLMQRAHRDAFALLTTLKNIPSNARGEKEVDVVTGIKSLFMDANQILDNMNDTVNEFDAVIKELEELEKELQESQLAMQTYTERSSNTMTALNKEIGELSSKISQLEKDRDAAYDKWLALTIASVAVTAIIAVVGIAISIALAAPTAGTGTVVAAGVTAAAVAAAGAGLGIAAGIARSNYSDLVNEVKTKSELKKKRTAFRHDLGALDKAMKFTLPSSGGVRGQLQDMRDGWKSLIEEARFKVGDLTVDNLSTSPWLKQDEMMAASERWRLVDTALVQFTTGSLVDYQLLEFGQTMPADDPKWLEKLQKKAA